MPDLVLRSVRQPGDTSRCDVHITGGVITQIVPAGTDLSTGNPTQTDAPALDGRTIIPGLWDEHVHLTQWALAAARFDLSAATSALEALEIVRAQAVMLDRATPGDAPARPGAQLDASTLIGVRFRDAIWADLPTLRGLDEVTHGHPTALISHDLHCVWLNSAAAGRFNVKVDASGLVREQAAFDLTIALGQLPDAEVDALAAQAGARAAARGVVGIVDFEMTWNRDVWQRRIANGFDALRVDAGIYLADFDRALTERMRTGQPVADTHDLLTVGPLKLLIDGSLNTRTAFCVDEYPAGGRGVLAVNEDELTEILLKARAAGLLPAVHAIGDAANTVALNAFERAAVAGRIEHAQFLQPKDFARFARLGVIASVQPEHALDDRDAVELNWAAGADRVFALRALLDAGATLALGSDAPVAPLDPFTAMSAATSRARSDGREPWRPHQVITRSEALAASARGRTRLQVGDVADIAVLDGDPLTVSDATFERMPVAATLLAGRPTHGAALLAP